MRKNRDSSENEEFSIKYVEVRVKGSSETLQNAIRNITDAVSGRPVISRVEQLPALPAKNGDAPTQQTSLSFDEAPEGELFEAPSTPKNIASKSKTKRSYPSPKLLDIDLDSGDVSFSTYCQMKNPGDTTKKYLVCAVWLKEQRGIQTFTADHIYTCYRKMS